MKSKVASMLQLAGQIAEKNGRALQHAQKNHRLSGEIPVDLSAHLSHTLGDLFTRNEDL